MKLIHTFSILTFAMVLSSASSSLALTSLEVAKALVNKKLVLVGVEKLEARLLTTQRDNEFSNVPELKAGLPREYRPSALDCATDKDVETETRSVGTSFNLTFFTSNNTCRTTGVTPLNVFDITVSKIGFPMVRVHSFFGTLPASMRTGSFVEFGYADLHIRDCDVETVTSPSTIGPVKKSANKMSYLKCYLRENATGKLTFKIVNK